ncbi:MAG: DUF4249 domain-containing protein [Bacteroidota bacterium]
MKSLPKNIFSILLFAACSAVFFSCQKVIQVDLNSSAPVIVIEGIITDQPGPYRVTLSQTVEYDQPNVFPPVSGAAVTLSDNLGNSELLTETSSGTYTSSHMQGVPGRTYTLAVLSNGTTYTAASTMPPPVTIDSLTEGNLSFGPNNTKDIEVHFRDPTGIQNYYRFVEIKNGVPQKFIFLVSDRLQDGYEITSTLFANTDTLRTGDSVSVQLQCIDENVYNYFRTLVQVLNNSSLATSPANPPSNFNGGALGYFSAYAVRSKLIIIR